MIITMTLTPLFGPQAYGSQYLDTHDQLLDTQAHSPVASASRNHSTDAGQNIYSAGI